MFYKLSTQNFNGLKQQKFYFLLTLPIHWVDRKSLLNLVIQRLKLIAQPPFWTLLERKENSGEDPPGKLWSKHVILPLTIHWLELGTWVHLTTGESESRENWKYLANNISDCHSCIEKVLNYLVEHRKLILYCMLAHWNWNKNLKKKKSWKSSFGKSLDDLSRNGKNSVNGAGTQCWLFWDCSYFSFLPQNIFQFNSLQLN